MVERVRPDVAIDFTGEVSRTKQAFKPVVDINNIVARFARTGMIEHVNRREPFYGDVSTIVDYQTCLNVVNKAKELFGNMSAKVRERFHNDPAEMISFLENPANLQEAIDLGMAVKRPEAPVAPVVPPVNP